MGGGSGNAGSIKYPQYLQTIHQKAIAGNSIVTPEELTFSIISSMNAEKNNNPFEDQTAYNPDTDIATYLAKIGLLETGIPSNPTITWEDSIDSAKTKIDNDILSETVLNELIQSNDEFIEDKLDDEIIPKFKAGMNDINSVMSSAFLLGEANIRSFGERDKNNFAKTLRLENYRQRNALIAQGSKDILSTLFNSENLREAVARYNIEGNRIKYVMKNEQQETQIHFDEQEALWDLSLFSYLGNTMSSIAGSAGLTKSSIPPSRSVLGGAFSGAAVGAQFGGPWGAAAGAVIGGGLGLVTHER